MTSRFLAFILPWAIAIGIAALLVIAWSSSSAPRGAADRGSDIPVSSPPFLGAPNVVDASRRIPESAQDGGLAPAVSELGSGAPLSPAPLEETVLPTGPADLTPSARSLSKVTGMGTSHPAGSQPSADTGPSAEPPAARPTLRDSQLQTAKPSIAIPDASSCVSPCAVSVGRVSFGGLHPILESWYVGVAEGIASHMGAGYPASYLALPIGRGFLVRIVGAGGHVEMRSTDAGPDLQKQREGRVADLSVAVFVKVCGVPASRGLCPVSITVLGRM